MRKLTIILLFIFSSSAFAQKSNFIANIRSMVQRINTDSTYNTRTLKDEELMEEEKTDNGGSLTGYFKGGTLTKINKWIGLSHSIITVEYYIDRGNLIFAHEQHKVFKEILSGDSLKNKLDDEHTKTTLGSKYYFHKGKLIKKETNGEPSENIAPVLFADFKHYTALLQNKI